MPDRLDRLTRAHQQGDDVAVAAQAVQDRGELLLARRKLGRVALPVEQLAARGGEALARIERAPERKEKPRREPIAQDLALRVA